MERFTSFDGTGIAYNVFGQEPEAHKAVVLHHGFASTAQINWMNPGLVDALAGAGRRVVVLDARGHGDSDKPHDPAAYAGRAMAKDVVALLDFLRLEEVHLAGYSMGSIVTLSVAPHEDRVKAVFLGGVGPVQALSDMPERAEGIAEALEADDPRSIAEPGPRAFRAFAQATGQDRLALAAVQRASAPPREEEIRAVTVPTLIVNGEKDTLIGDPFGLGALIVGSRTTIVPGDHLSAVTKPEFRDALVDWATKPVTQTI